jgi:hypothetical protein
MVQDSLAGTISTPALVSRNGGTGGRKDDAAICGPESRKRSLDLSLLAIISTQARCKIPALIVWYVERLKVTRVLEESPDLDEADNTSALY